MTNTDTTNPTPDSPNWQAIIDESIQRVRGDSRVPINGAKLRQTMQSILSERGYDLTKVLKEGNLTFSQFLEKESPGLILVRRRGTDMLVAKMQDEISPLMLYDKDHGRSEKLRSELYLALVDYSSGFNYYYNVRTNKVERSEEPLPLNSDHLIPLPRTTKEEQLSLRKAFAQQYGLGPLQLTLTEKGNELRDFKDMLFKQGQGLGKKWHIFKFSHLKDKLLKWASDNKLEVREDWFGGPMPTQEITPNVRQFLREVSEYMDEEELGRLAIPLKAVFDYWIAHKQRGK